MFGDGKPLGTRREADERLEILPRRKAATRAAQHDDANVATLLGAAQRVDQFDGERVVERVEFFGTIEGEGEDSATFGSLEYRFAHAAGFGTRAMSPASPLEPLVNRDRAFELFLFGRTVQGRG